MNDCYFKMDKKCAILKSKCCRGCKFRKTRKQLDEGRRKAMKRLMSLPYARMVELLKKYHGEGSVEYDET